MEPKWLTWARGQIGIKEVPGPRSNPTVEQYYFDATGARHSDDIPWCSAFVGAALKRGAGIAPSGSLMARSYLKWGQALRNPVPGAIVVFARGTPPQGHVAIVEEDLGNALRVIGGNQSDAVTRALYPKTRVLGYRWPTGVPLGYKSLRRGAAPEESMDAQEIMETVSKLHSQVDSMGYSEVRPAVKKALACLFYLAKLNLPSGAKAMSLRPRKKPKRKLAHDVERRLAPPRPSAPTALRRKRKRK